MSEPTLFGNDLFGNPVDRRPPGRVAEQFLFPPFSVLDAKGGEWQTRKRAWRAMGIQSELGREAKTYHTNEWLAAKLAKPIVHEGDGTSIFDPVLCELAYRWFCPPDGQVVDPFAGGSVRGIVAASTGRRYWGCDLATRQIEANYDQARAICPDAIAVDDAPADSFDWPEPEKEPAGTVPFVPRDAGRGRRVLLVVPPYLTTDRLVADLYPMPLAAVTLAAVLRADGWRVTIKDFLIPAQTHKATPPESFAGRYAPPYVHYGADWDTCQAWIDANIGRFDAVGLCAGQCNLFEGAARIAGMIRAAGKPLVVGGPFATAAPDEARRLIGEALYVAGEGELVVSDAVERAIAGDTSTIRNADRVDLNTLPLPAWDLVDLAAYPHQGAKVRGVLTVSRGCPWHCVFCSVSTVAGRRHRRAAPERVRALIAQLAAHGVRRFCFLDDNLLIHRRAVEDVVGTIEQMRADGAIDPRATFYVEEGLEVRTAAASGVVARMAAAGFDSFAIGLETASNATARAVRKPYSPEQLERAVESFRAAGITPKAFYIIGLPGETVDTAAAALVEFGRLGMDARANNLKVYPGTALHTVYHGKGIVPDDYDWRLSSFYTPETPGLTYADVRRLKTYLGAVGLLAAEFGHRVFSDGLAEFCLRAGATTDESGALRWPIKPFRPTRYQRAAELVLIADGARGATATVQPDGTIVAVESDPTSEVQTAIVRAARGERNEPVRTGTRPRLEWVNGDSMIELDNAPPADFVFSCPPYGDLEVYTDDPADLSRMEWHTFVAAYRRIILRCVKALKPDRFACFVVGDFRDNRGFFRGLVGETITAFELAGARFYNDAVLATPIGSACVRAGKQFSTSRKLVKIHQNVLVFVKGDPRAATRAITQGRD